MSVGGNGIAGLAGSLDEQRFVGRSEALAVASAAMDGHSAHRLIHLHGPAGVGKSGLLRAIERLALARGFDVHRFDGRAIDPSSDGLATAFEELLASGVQRVLVTVDEVSDLAAVRFELRTALGRLPESAVVVVAGRRAPDRDWFDGALEHITARIALDPLDMRDSRDLLSRYGVTEPAEVEAILGWAAGYPAALVIAATTRASCVDSGLVGSAVDEGDPGRRLDGAVLARLAGREFDDLDPEVLNVAAIAPAVDARLLAAVLPSRPTRTGLKDLRELSVSESVGGRILLHRLVRRAVRARLRESDPVRYRTLVLAIAEHLRDRTHGGEPRAALELIGMVDDPLSRSGYGPSVTHYTDRVRAGDAARAGDLLGATGTAWWGRVTRWFEECPEQVVIVRATDGALAAIGVSFTIEQMPAWAMDHIETGPVVDYLRSIGAESEAVLVQDVHLLHDPADPAGVAEAIRVGNMKMFAVTANPNPRYMVATAPSLRSGDGSEVWGYAEVEAMRRSDAERHLVTTMADFGPDGAVDAIYSMICAEHLGPDEAPSGGGRGASIIAALREFHDDDFLARGRLGDGEGAARVASARAVVRAAVADAFTDSAADTALRRALERTYIDVDGGHAVAREELFMSRSTFYRHLQRARDRLATSAR